MSSAGNEARRLGGHGLKSEPGYTTKPGLDEALAQDGLVDQPLHGVGRGGSVVGGYKQREIAELPHPADGSGDRRQAARIGLDQDLGQAFGAGDVQEGVTPPVELEQASVERDVATKLAVPGQAEFGEALLERGTHAAFSANDQAPAPVASAKEAQDVREQQRVLLGIEAADGQERQLRDGVSPLGGTGASFDVARADKGDRGVEDARGVAVAPSEVRPHGDHGRSEGERSPAALEHPRGGEQLTPAGVPVAHVGGKVLAHAQHQATPPNSGHQRQADRVREGTEREDDVGVVKSPPHARDGARNGSQHRPELSQLGVVRQGNELDRAAQAVVGRAGSAVEAPEQAQPSDLVGELAQEAHERPVGVDRTPALAVEVVGVDEQHGNGSARSRRESLAGTGPGSAVAVSVLTPVLNEAAVLEQTVPTMLAQRLDVGEIEFIFAEGNSTDGTREMLEGFAAADPRVRVIDNPSGRTPDALNLALAQAQGEYVARMDAHCFYPPTYLADGIARLAQGDVAWVAGPAVPRAYGGFSGAIALAWRSPLGRGPSQRRIPSGNGNGNEVELGTSVFLGVWRRSTLERYGGWDPQWLRNQDSELAARLLDAGERIVSLSSMAAELLPRRTVRAFARQYHGYGRYRARTLARHPLARRRTHTLALAPALAAAVPAAASRRRVLRAPARMVLSAYAAAVAMETARAARAGAPLDDVAGLPAAFAAMHLAFGAGMWRGLGEAWLSSRSNELSSRNHARSAT